MNNQINYDELAAAVTMRMSQDKSMDGDGWKPRPQQTFAIGSALAPILKSGGTWERKQPIASATITAQVLVPALRALGCGICGGILTGLLGGPQAGVIGFFTVGAFSFFPSLFVSEKALWQIEKLTGKDLNADGKVGKPSLVQVEILDRENNTVHYADIPASDDQLSYLAHALFVQQQPFSREKLAGKGKPISDPAFRKLQKAMRDAELIWPNGDGHNAGFKLNSAGRQFLTQFLQKQ